MLKKWLRALIGGPNSSPAGKPPARRLTLEALEDRCVPSLAVQSISGIANSPTVLAQDITSGSIQISSASYTGSPLAAGIFTGGGADLGMSSGIVLDTGKVSSIPGFLTSTTALPGGTNLGQPGDANLNVTTGSSSHDAAILTFNFIAQGPLVSFNFVFASNEFTIGTATALNADTFAAYINGSNRALFINNPAGSRNINPADMVTAGTDRINDPKLAGGTSPLDIQFARLTPVLTTVPIAVVPGQVNTVKLVIADVGASALTDSAVFIQAQSFGVSARVFAAYPLLSARNAFSTTFSGYITIQNNGPGTLNTKFTDAISGVTSTLGVAFPVLPPGVTVTSSIPFVTNSLGQKFIPLPFSLAAGQFIRIPVRFSNPFHVPLFNFFNGQALDVQYFQP
jgi:hypothetical protein